jgi:hypothetical protein
MTAQDLAWFEAGEAVGAGERDRAQFPPLDDARAQRWWLGGFASAWAVADAPAAAPDASPSDPEAALGHDDPRVALSLALAAHPRLAAVLFARQIPAVDRSGLH